MRKGGNCASATKETQGRDSDLGAAMLSILRKLFVGVSAFAVGLLYFFALSLSITTVWSGLLPWYAILGAWTIISLVLYEEREYSQIAQAFRSALDRRTPD